MAAPRLILASASPRRGELLSQIGIPFETVPQHIDETPLEAEAADALAIRLSREKAAAALAAHADNNVLVLGSDTVVVHGDTIMGQPQNKAEAQVMLLTLSASQHQVHTAVTVCDKDRQVTELSSTEVAFRHISEAEAARYWDSGEPLGKAGGYAIQGLGAVFVQSITGSYSGVMGLPLFETAKILQQFGLPAWQNRSSE